ncbi:hypothetical protein Avbf_12376, partial [Armadillidium vulgare]
YLHYGTITCNMPRHYEKKEGTRRIMYRQDYIARAMIDVQDFLRKAERGKHNENEIAFKDPENVDIYDIEKGQIMKKMIIKDIRRGFIFFINTCKGLTLR